MKIHIPLLAIIATLVTLPIAQATAFADAVHKAKPGDGSKGTNQMAGGAGKFGVTYTLTDHNGLVINYTILSASYKIEPIYWQPGNTTAPNSTQKVLEIHYKVKNPNPTDMYYNGNDYLQVIDPLGQTITTNDGQGRNVVTDQPASGQLKPGQGVDDIVTYALVPAAGAVPKLIITLPRLGVNEKVIRFELGTAPNLVKQLPAEYANPSDPTGINAAATIPAKFGETYVVGFFSMSVSSPQFVTGSIRGNTPDQGKKFLTVQVKLTNITSRKQYVGANGSMAGSLTDTDGDAIPVGIEGNGFALKPTHDDYFEGRQLDPNTSALFRIGFIVPSDATLQQMKLHTFIDNSGHNSEDLVYDVSAVK